MHAMKFINEYAWFGYARNPCHERAYLIECHLNMVIVRFVSPQKSTSQGYA